MKGSVFEENPYACALAAEALDTHCSYCFRSVDDLSLYSSSPNLLKRCGRCQICFYCSPQCQTNDWKTGHKHECACFSKAREEKRQLPSDHSRCLLKILNRHETEKKVESVDPDKRKISDLLTHKDDVRQNEGKMKHFTQVYSDLLSYVAPSAHLLKLLNETDQEIVFEMHCRLVINGFLIGESLIGTGIYIECSRMDHSCTPDVNVVFIGNRACLRSVKNEIVVSGGTELGNVKTTYCDPMSGRSARRTHMKATYFFECDCERCKTDIFADSKSLESQLNRIKCPTCPGTFVMSLDQGDAAKSTKCDKCGQQPPKKKITQMHKTLTNLNQQVTEIDVDGMSDKDELDVCLGYVSELSKLCDAHHWLLLRARRRALQMAFDCHENATVIELASLILSTLALFSLPYHTTTADIWYKLAKAYIASQMFVDARHTLQNTLDVVQHSHGVGHPLHIQIQQFIVNLDGVLMNNSIK